MLVKILTSNNQVYIIKLKLRYLEQFKSLRTHFGIRYEQSGFPQPSFEPTLPKVCKSIGVIKLAHLPLHLHSSAQKKIQSLFENMSYLAQAGNNFHKVMVA